MRFAWRIELPQWIILAAMLTLAAVSWAGAPDRIPVHWNIAGEVDRYGGKFEGLLGIPLLAAGLYLAMLLLPRIDPGRANYARFESSYATIRISMLVLMAVLYGLVQSWIHNRPVDISSAMPLVMGGLFVVIGGVMGKIRPNWFVGVRTPWTLSSKVSWSKTHRLGGWLFILVGLATMMAGFVHARVAFWILIGGISGSTVLTVVYSYLVWRRDPEKIPPANTLPADEG